MERLNAAVIGCGRMGAFTSEDVKRHAPACWFPLNHAEAIAANPALRLAAVCDVDAAAVQRAAQAHAVPATFTDPNRLLEEIRPAVLGIATRTIGRADLIERAVASGTRALHVEKPLCNSVAELASLRACLGRPDVFATYGAIRRFFPIYRRARALAESGTYGALREIRVQMGSAALYWTHAHSIDLMLFSAGERRPIGVQARLAEVERGDAAADIQSDPRVIAATVHFEDGVTGHVTQALGADLVFSCSEGEIEVRADGHALEVYAARDGSPYPTRERLGDGGNHGGEPGGTLAPVSQLVACLQGDAAAIAANAVVKRDILLGQQIAFAIVQSHLEGSRIVPADALDDTMFIHARTGGRHA